MTLLDILTKSTPIKESPKPAAANVSFGDPLYGLSVKKGRILVGSFIKSSNENYVSVDGRKFFHRLPASKVAWSPIADDDAMFASTSTSLRIWRTGEKEKPILKLQSASKLGATAAPSPLASFDWNPVTTSRIAVAAVDSTIAIWDIEKGKMETQMIAHDKAVFDVVYGNAHQIASVSEDGSLRLFDTRDLDHSTIVYEASSPLLRVSWSANHIATIGADTSSILLFDLRKSGFVAGTLKCQSCPNAIAWSGSGLLAAGLVDGSGVVFNLTASDVPSSYLVPPPPGYVGGGITNTTWASNEALVQVHGSNVSTQSIKI